MRILLDSHVALWWLEGSSKLGPNCQQRVADASEVYFSPVSPWELGIKKSLGKIDYPDGLVDALTDAGFIELPISATHATEATNLPRLHRDPFDRMLIAQARTESLTLCTADRRIGEYEVDVLEANS